jgi:hypothetical protein
MGRYPLPRISGCGRFTRIKTRAVRNRIIRVFMKGLDFTGSLSLGGLTDERVVFPEKAVKLP